MDYEPMYKKPGDLIRSDEWNKIVDELKALKSYIENMTRSVTLTALPSPIGRSFALSTGVTEDFNYGVDVMGLITRQYYGGAQQTGDICRFGLSDYADIISYWSGAANGDKEALVISIEYVDGSVFTSEKLYIHEWSNLRPKGSKNPYVEYLQSPNQRLWYRYVLVNPDPDKEIRYITFKDSDPDCALRIANVMHYVTRVKPLAVKPE
ncbi:hypothetical protein CUJ83_04905 [Methanocella sp. CWC-04]|uniref:Uncharacterized protein n=2 Tax=Methanooceanicella nereidis TaxID=2052831 RepID=A0AAP2RC36_9EURY|nr:hypothetical protein [Methanocella sp. CWC-04]